MSVGNDGSVDGEVDRSSVSTVGDGRNRQVPSKNEVYDDGKLWSLIRSVMTQGADIYLDHLSKPYEAYSARLDVAALERVEAFKALRAAVETPLDIPDFLRNQKNLASERHAVETDMLHFEFPKAWAPYLRAVILGAQGDFDNTDLRWHLNALADHLSENGSDQ